MKVIFYSKDASFELTDEEFNQALVEFDKGKRVYIRRINVSLSPLYIWAGEKPSSKDFGILHDGARVHREFGQWKLDNNPSCRIDPSYYPEVADDTVMSPEEFKNKQLSLTNKNGE